MCRQDRAFSGAMILTKTTVLAGACWAACLLFLVTLAEHGMISRSRASVIAHEILWRSRHQQRVVDMNNWVRPNGPVPLHMCSRNVPGAMPPIATTRFAVVVLLTLDDSDMYTLAAIKLGHSLRWWFPPEQLDLILMVTENFGISGAPDFARRVRFLKAVGWNILCRVPIIESPRSAPDNRFHGSRVYSRLNVWGLTEYDAVLSLDLDTLVIRDPSPLFTHHLAAMRAAGLTLGAARDRPDARSASFNAGVLLVIPSQTQLHSLTAGIASTPHDLEYAEQGYLNAVYNQASYHVLPFQYNANVVSKLYDPDLWRKDKTIAHFTVAKPWQSFRRLSSSHMPFLCWFWDVDDMCQLWDMVPRLNAV